MQDIYLGRQPILDAGQKTVAYELLFRNAATGPALISDDSMASANVIVSAFCDLGVQQVLGEHKGYININAETLFSSTVELLPPERVVLELLETVDPDDTVVERCRELKRKGFRIAIDDVTEWGERQERLLDWVDVLKVDVLNAGEEVIERVVAAARDRPLLLLAEKVETRERVAQCRELGFHLFQGYYFARPEILVGRRSDPARMALLRLLSLVLSDTGPEEIEQAIKPHAGLSYNLLRLVNSVASGLSRRIDSLRQAVVILGRRQLLRWVQLLLYTATSDGQGLTSPLIQLAATRGKLMELLAVRERPGDAPWQDQAFMVGILSLLETLLGVPMAEIVGQLQLAPHIGDALLERKGALGRLLQIQEWLEAGEAGKVTVACRQSTGFTLNDLMRAQLEAMRWAHSLGEQAA